MRPYLKDFEKCVKVIKSCKTDKQLLTARNMVTFFFKKYNKEDEYKDILGQECKKREHVISHYGNTLEGSKCIVVGNEIDPVFSAEILYFEDWGKPHQMPLPIVRKDDDGKEYLSMGIVLPYDKELMDKLNLLPQPERWNLVCRGENKIK